MLMIKASELLKLITNTQKTKSGSEFSVSFLKLYIIMFKLKV